MTAVVGNPEAARRHFERARALNPSDPWVLAGLVPSPAKGGLNETIALQRRVVAIDPLSAVSRSNLGVYLMAAGEWEEAKSEFGRALELSPDWPEVRRDIAKILILQRRFDEALAAADQLPAGPLRDQCLALAYHAAGDAAAADAALGRLVVAGEQQATDAYVKLNIAEVYAFRGDGEEAFRWLALVSQLTRDENATTPGWWTEQELPLSPFLKPLQTDARWQSLLSSGLKAS